MERVIKSELMEEIFFMNPNEELQYFEKRLAAIEQYDNDFLVNMSKARLAQRYIRALAVLSLEDPMEVRAFRDLYVDCLTRLGVSDYCINQEVMDYISTHSLSTATKKDMFVSNSGRKGMK